MMFSWEKIGIARADGLTNERGECTMISGLRNFDGEQLEELLNIQN